MDVGDGLCARAVYPWAFSPPEDRHFPNAFEGWDLASWGAGPAVQGPLGMSTAGRDAKSSASGPAAAKARRTRLAISMTRAAILSSLRRSVANSQREIARFGNGVADGKHQPVGGGVEDEANLIGERRAARRAVGGELSLVQLDEIFRLAASAVEGLVEPFGRTAVEIGDDEADVEAEFALPRCGRRRAAPCARNRLCGASRRSRARRPCRRWRARCARRRPSRRLSWRAAWFREGRTRSRRRSPRTRPSPRAARSARRRETECASLASRLGSGARAGADERERRRLRASCRDAG